MFDSLLASALKGGIEPMKGIPTAAAAVLMIACFVCPGTTRAQQPEPDKKNKLTLSEVEAQVEALQTQVGTLQTGLAAVVPDDFAVVSSAGALVRGSASAVSALQDGTGKYQVTFNKDITGCAYIGTIGDPSDGIPSPGEITVNNIGGNDSVIDVHVYDSTGTAANNSFHLSLSCE
jgi:hypothetical protein